MNGIIITGGIVQLELGPEEASLLAKACRLAQGVVRGDDPDAIVIKAFGMMFAAAAVAAAGQQCMPPEVGEELAGYVVELFNGEGEE